MVSVERLKRYPDQDAVATDSSKKDGEWRLRAISSTRLSTPPLMQHSTKSSVPESRRMWR